MGVFRGANGWFANRGRHGPGGGPVAAVAGRHLAVLPAAPSTTSRSTSCPSNSRYSGKIASVAMSKGPRL
jgi:hypothetical protein